MWLISLSASAIISDRPAEKCEPFLSAGSEQRMNYELRMPFYWGHRPFTMLTWSPSPSNKRRSAARWTFVLQSQMLWLSIWQYNVCAFFVFVFFKSKQNTNRGLKNWLRRFGDNWLLLTFNTDNGVTAFSSCNNYRFPQQQTVPFLVWCVTIIALREIFFKHFILSFCLFPTKQMSSCLL